MKKLIIFFGILFISGAGLLSFDVVEKVESMGETKILFVGDMMFDRTIRKRMEANGFDHVFSCVKDRLQDYDLVVGNLEGPITKNNSVNLNTLPGEMNNMTFTFPLEIGELLNKNNIKAVSLANNHIFDFGKSGLEETREALQKAKVSWFGDPMDQNKKTFIFEKDIVIVGFNQFLGVDSVEKTVSEIKRLKTEDSKPARLDSESVSGGLKIIIFAHWGEEYVPANQYQKNSAHAFIDAGADLVLGAHPHVIQDLEIYKGKTIYYSLGNFIFDQWWDPAVRRGMGVELLLKDETLTTNPIYFESSRDGRTCLVQ